MTEFQSVLVSSNLTLINSGTDHDRISESVFVSSNHTLINLGTDHDRIPESVFEPSNLTLINSATVHDRIPDSVFVSSNLTLINSATVHDRIVPDHGCTVCSICVSVRVVTGPDLYVAFRSSSDQACLFTEMTT